MNSARFDRLYLRYVICLMGSVTLGALGFGALMFTSVTAIQSAYSDGQQIAVDGDGEIEDAPREQATESKSTAPWSDRLMVISSLAAALVSVIMAIVGPITALMLVYSAWKVIQGPYARTTPGKAVGLLFVPVFNLYWVFVAYRGLAEDLNYHMEKQQIKSSDVSVRLATLLCLLVILAGVLSAVSDSTVYFGMLTGAVASLVSLVFLNSVKNAGMAIADAAAGPQ